MKIPAVLLAKLTGKALETVVKAKPDLHDGTPDNCHPSITWSNHRDAFDANVFPRPKGNV